MPGITSKTKTATILTGATGLSGAVYLGAQTLVGIQMPATWVAAVLTFQASADADGATFADLYTDVAGTNTEVSKPVSASKYIRLDPADFVGIQWIKFRSGTTAVPVNQTATRLLTVRTVCVPR